MFAKFSIRAKIIAAVAFLLVALTGMGLLAVWNMRAINASTVDITTNWLPSVRVLGELRAGVITYRNVIREHMLSETLEEKLAAEKTLAGVVEMSAKARAKYEPMIATPEERALYQQWSETWDKYRKGTEEVMAISRKEAGKLPHEAHELNTKVVNKIGLEADEILNKDIELNNVGAEKAAQDSASNYSSALMMVAVILGLAILISVGVSLYTVRDISAGIASIVSPMQALGRGDLTAVVPHQGEKTEIGAMADTLQVFKEALVAKKAADEAAAADAEAKIERGRRVDTITRNFEQMIGEIVQTVSSASTQLEASASTLSSTARRSQELTTSVAAASEEASTNVQSVASATEELSSSVTEISRQVQESARMAGDAVGQARTTNDRVSELSKAAARIGDVVELINTIAGQTNLLALNATIEAARAGTAGRGFAVVAGEVKNLAEATRQATHQISDTVRDLDGQIGSLIGESGDASLRAKSASEGAQQISGIISRVQDGFSLVGAEIGSVARAATSNLGHCESVITELNELAKGVDLSSRDLKHADGRVAKLLELSESLIVTIADSGVETSDTPLIRVVIETAKRISDLFENAVAQGDITLAQLMDENYREIAGTDPKQYLTDYVSFTDRVLPAIQDPIQKADPRIVFCVAWARGGYLPTHNPNYRQPQGPDPVWNNANCRNRRLFNDRAVSKVAANTKPFLLQTYRRDMGGGNFVLMKDLSSPIFVGGRHWGAFRMGFRQG